MLNTINAVFNNPTARKVFLRLRVPLALVLVWLIAYTARTDLLCIGFAVSMFGQAIQLWSFASLVKNEQLTARGPYVMVRNPMYLGRYFMVLGFLLVVGGGAAVTIAVVVAYTLLYWFYMYNRVRREETRLAGLLGEPYRAYGERVNRFLPNLGRIGDPAVRFFNWGVLTNNNGHWNLLATLAAWGALTFYLHYVR
jgi:protein-S-isoprenylcysteine O-methyltransferase Ste14